MNLTAFMKNIALPLVGNIGGNANLSTVSAGESTKGNMPPNSNSGIISEGQGRECYIYDLAYRTMYATGDCQRTIDICTAANIEKCQPPLDEREFNHAVFETGIARAENDIKNNPEWKTPEERAAADFDDLRKLDAQKCKFDPLYVSVTYLSEVGGKLKDKKTCRLIDFRSDPELIISVTVLPVEENMILLLAHYGLDLKFNIIKQSPELWKQEQKQGQLQLFYSHIRDLCDKQGIKIPTSKFDDMLLSIARRMKYNPFEEYLTECAAGYDGKDYIAELCKTIVSPLSETVKRKYITKFLLEMAYVSTSNDGDDTAQHFMLVLKGGQGDGKSAWLMSLLPEWAQRENYFLPGRTCDLKNKDHILEQSTALLVEWGEIAATFRKSDQEEVKAYITRKMDRLRPPYFKEAIDIKRRMCLCATVNDDEFLRDTTGDRRYTVIPCIDIDYMHSVDMSQVWGQIYKMKLAGVPYWYSKTEIAEVIAANSQHRVKSDLQFTLETLYDLFPEAEPEKWLFAKDIMQSYEFCELTKKTQVTPKSVTQALKGLGVQHRDIQRVAAFRIVRRGAEAVKAVQPLTGKPIKTEESEDFLQ